MNVEEPQWVELPDIRTGTYIKLLGELAQRKKDFVSHTKEK